MRKICKGKNNAVCTYSPTVYNNKSSVNDCSVREKRHTKLAELSGTFRFVGTRKDLSCARWVFRDATEDDKRQFLICKKIQAEKKLVEKISKQLHTAVGHANPTEWAISSENSPGLQTELARRLFLSSVPPISDQPEISETSTDVALRSDYTAEKQEQLRHRVRRLRLTAPDIAREDPGL